MSNQGKNSYNLQKTNPLLFTANTSSPFDEVFAPAIAAPAQPVICNTPAAANVRAPAGPAALPPPAGPSSGSGGGDLLNNFPALPQHGGRHGGTAAFAAPAGPNAVPVSVFSPKAPPQQPSEVASQPGGVTPRPGSVAPCLDPLQPHLGSRQPVPAAPPVPGTMAGPPAQSAVRPPPPALSAFSPPAAASPPAPSTSVTAQNPAVPTTADLPPTASSISPGVGTQFADRPLVAPPSHQPPSGAAVPPPPKGGAASVTMRRGASRCQYAPPPGLSAPSPGMSAPSPGMSAPSPGLTPFATPRGSITEPGPVVTPLMASMTEPSGEMPRAPAPVTPLVFHWFYAKSSGVSEPEDQQEKKEQPQTEPSRPGEPSDWQPFSRADSDLLESHFQAGTGGLVPVLGRRYDVDVAGRSLLPVYWECAPGAVRRCSWFSRGVHESKFVPYEEEVADKLEEIYGESSRTGQWHRDVQLGEEGYVVLHSPGCLVHHPGITHAWEEVTMPDDPSRPRQMRRGWDMVEGTVPPPDEPETVNHLVFVVHGIGSWCDLKFRKVTECVDDMRTMAAEMAGSHFSSALCSGRLGRVEFLPISWHHALHGAAGGLDEALRLITLPSIPLLREFTNDTIVDVLYYTSPIFCQLILRTVGDDINSIYRRFCERNPGFSGSVSVAGHSLGSLILFDILSNQTGETPDTEPTSDSPEDPQLSDGERYTALLRRLKLEQHSETLRRAEADDVATLRLLTDLDVDRLELPLGARRRLINWRDSANNKPGVGTVTVSYDTHTGQPAMQYPQLAFKPACFFGMGSPIALFLRIRGINMLGPEFRLPTCSNVFNIYHPFDPVSFRIEPLIEARNVRRRPVLVPHHKGRKRMHLEIKEQVVRMGTELKQRLMSSLQSTLGSVYSLGWGAADESGGTAELDPAGQTPAQTDERRDLRQTEEPTGPVGALNGGRRIDYVLQERPFESLNEYVFAFQSHLCYWDSEDTLLLILKETLRESGIEADRVQRTEPPAGTGSAAAVAAGTVTNAASPGTVPNAAQITVKPAAFAVPSPPTAPAAPAGPAPPVSVVVTPPGAVAMDVPPLPGAVPVPPVPGVPGVPAVPPVPGIPPVPAVPGIAPSARAVGGRPLYLPPSSGGPRGMDPTVERREGAAPPPPPPTAGFRRS